MSGEIAQEAAKVKQMYARARHKKAVTYRATFGSALPSLNDEKEGNRKVDQHVFGPKSVHWQNTPNMSLHVLYLNTSACVPPTQPLWNDLNCVTRHADLLYKHSYWFPSSGG